jgi:hypothetical protein
MSFFSLVRDDGLGGADPSRAADRWASRTASRRSAEWGVLTSPAKGTTIQVELPFDND